MKFSRIILFHLDNNVYKLVTNISLSLQAMVLKPMAVKELSIYVFRLEPILRKSGSKMHALNHTLLLRYTAQNLHSYYVLIAVTEIL